MPDANQQPGLLSEIGTGLSDVAGGISKVLPYAIPIGLGAAMGGGVGAGLGGAAAGLASAEGEAGERQQRQQELAMKQQELAMEGQEWALKKKQGELALQNDQATEDYAKSIKDPEQQARFRSDPKSYFEQGDWNHYTNALKTDPGFAKAQGIDPELAKALPNMPPAMGKSIIEAVTKANAEGKFINGRVTVTNADGTTTVYGIGPDGKKTPIVSGISSSKLASNLKDDKTEQALNTKAVAALTSEYSKYRAENDKVAQANAKKFGFQTADPLPHPDLPDSADDYIAKGLDSRVNLLRVKGSAPMSDPNAKLKSAGLPAAKPPKELWGKTGTLNGKRVKIDDKGNVSPL